MSDLQKQISDIATSKNGRYISKNRYSSIFKVECSAKHVFEEKTSYFLDGGWCKKCEESTGKEHTIEKTNNVLDFVCGLLDKESVEYKRNAKINDSKESFDIVIPYLSLVIEYDIKDRKDIGSRTMAIFSNGYRVA